MTAMLFAGAYPLWTGGYAPVRQFIKLRLRKCNYLELTKIPTVSILSFCTVFLNWSW